MSGEVVDYFGLSHTSLPVVDDWPGTLLAVNVGGAVIPTLVSYYLPDRYAMALWIRGAARRGGGRPRHSMGSPPTRCAASASPVPVFAPALITAVLAPGAGARARRAARLCGRIARHADRRGPEQSRQVAEPRRAGRLDRRRRDRSTGSFSPGSSAVLLASIWPWRHRPGSRFGDPGRTVEFRGPGAADSVLRCGSAALLLRMNDRTVIARRRFMSLAGAAIVGGAPQRLAGAQATVYPGRKWEVVDPPAAGWSMPGLQRAQAQFGSMRSTGAVIDPQRPHGRGVGRYAAPAQDSLRAQELHERAVRARRAAGPHQARLDDAGPADRRSAAVALTPRRSRRACATS